MNEKIQWLFGSMNDQLLKKILKQLIYLVVFEETLNALLVLKLLKLVHINFISS